MQKKRYTVCAIAIRRQIASATMQKKLIDNLLPLFFLFNNAKLANIYNTHE